LDDLPSEKIEVRIDPRIELSGDRIVIGKGSRIHPRATIEGPVRIGRNVEVGPGAVIRGGSWIGNDCVVGGNTEVQGSILMDRVHVQPLGFIADSILGAEVFLGAGTILSNQRDDRQEISLPGPLGSLSTGRDLLGAILGDSAKLGNRCALDPGVIIGRDCRLESGICLRSGIYPDSSLIKLLQTLEVVDWPS
jgi:NDP-sugar pyrophosphorylase family protein